MTGVLCTVCGAWVYLILRTKGRYTHSARESAHVKAIAK